MKSCDTSYSRYPLPILGIILAAAAAVGVLMAENPRRALALAFAPAALWLTIRAVSRNLQRQQQRDYLWRVVFWGVLLRLFLVGVHLVVGLWFYDGRIDFVGWQWLIGEVFEQALNGRFDYFVFSSDTVTSGLGNLSILTSSNVFLLTLLGAVMGPSLLEMFLGCVAVGTAGAYLFLRAFQKMCPDPHSERFLAAALFLLPAINFWSIMLGKDVLVFFLMGWATYAVARLLERPHFGQFVGLVLSVALLTGVRPYIGISVGFGAAIGLTLQPLPSSGRAAFRRLFKPLVLFRLIWVIFAFLGYIGFLHMGIESVTPESIATRAYMQHRGFAATEAGSALPLAISSPDPSTVMLSIPYGIFTLFFRPFPWEAHNGLALAAALQNVFLMGLIVWRWRILARALAAVRWHPFLLYVLVVLTIGSIAISFNWQLGTMARHRTMVLPYLLMLLAGLGPRKVSVAEDRRTCRAEARPTGMGRQL